jgi:precorrin-6A/cobalt-precorrin-6A reductase
VVGRVLLLGGTSEASALSAELALDGRTELIVSLAGRTEHPRVANGQLRVGGFGGPDGLAAFLLDQSIDVVVDATHPFAATMPFNAAAACHRAGVPLLKLYRPPWTPCAGDRWMRVADLDRAAAMLVERGARRVLLTTGRQELEPFRALRGVSFVVRSVEPPDLAGFESATALLARGPFDVEGERALFRAQAFDTLVTKNSGGSATAAKLEAARDLGIEVVMVDRPPLPVVPLVASVAEARLWLSQQLNPTDSGAGSVSS